MFLTHCELSDYKSSNINEDYETIFIIKDFEDLDFYNISNNIPISTCILNKSIIFIFFALMMVCF